MDANEPPEFEVPSVSIDVVENTEANTVIGDPVEAIDPESTELKYSLAGTDSGLFSIDDSSGQISVGAATTVDYESPSDSNGDNIYEFVVQVTDGQDEDGNPDDSVDAEIGVTVTVAEVDEPPEFEVLYVWFEVEENTAALTNVGDPILATDPELAELTYSLVGADAALFDFDPSTGLISIGAATELDHETPSDSNGDNVYEIIETPTYEWPHSLGDIVSALIDAGLRIEFLHEFPFTCYQAYPAYPVMERGDDGWWRFPKHNESFPQMFSIRATR